MSEEFRNREEYGFRREGEHTGCIFGIGNMSNAYRDGQLDDKERNLVDQHLLGCRRCGNTWDALASREEETFPTEISEED